MAESIRQAHNRLNLVGKTFGTLFVESYEGNRLFNSVTKALIEWARELNIDQASLRERLEKWPLAKALTQPKKATYGK